MVCRRSRREEKHGQCLPQDKLPFKEIADKAVVLEKGNFKIFSKLEVLFFYDSMVLRML